MTTYSMYPRTRWYNRLHYFVLLFFMLFHIGMAKAQTTLAEGDIVFTSFDASLAPGSGKFSFVLLANISAGTTISFTDQGYHGSGWEPAGEEESAITWTSGTAIPMGTEVQIVGLSASTYNPMTSVLTLNGTVVLTDGATPNGLSLSNVGDQIIAFQGGSGEITGIGATCIAGINYFYTGTSTTGGWNVGAPTGPNSSLMPPGLTGGTSAFYTGAITGPTGAVSPESGKFDCTGTPTSAVALVRAVVMNVANWSLLVSLSGTPGYAYSGCQFIGSNPVITGNPPNRTICSGGNTTFSITATGATSYQWYQNTGGGFVALANGAPFSGVTTTTLSITGATGTMRGYRYQCVASNSSGSATSYSATLTVSSVSASATSTALSSVGATDGTATATASGGFPPYTYSWSPSGGTAVTATGLAAGTYTVTVTDNIGCTTTATTKVMPPAPLISGTTEVTHVKCYGGNNGAIDLTPTGGTAPYSYNWDGGITTTQDRAWLVAGSYSVIITDANGYTETVDVEVTQPAAPLSGTTVVTSIACNGGATGAINLTPSGGTGPYTFDWGGGITTKDRTGLVAGDYSVKITDANGCTKTIDVEVTQPAAFTVGTSQTNVSCNGGSNGTATVSVTGGTPGYRYSWAPSGGTGPMASGLAAGTYTVTITDGNLCKTTRSFTITEPTAFEVDASQTNVSCRGGSNGTATVSVSGATGPYTYSWWPSGGTNATATGLSERTYTVTITDANSCQTTREFTITQPASVLTVTPIAQTNVACNGGATGSATVEATGGTGPYTYSWSPSGGTAATATGLRADTYTVTVTDANGCTATQNFTITEPSDVLDATTSQINATCSTGGQASVSAFGGTPGYTYRWTRSGSATIIDTTPTVTGLAAGSHSCQITDANGCTITRNFIITTTNTLVASTAQTDILCHGASTGSASVVPSGAAGPFTYVWSNGGSSDTQSNLSVGNYSVTITAANGCSIVKNFTITEPSAITISLNKTNPTMVGATNGSITATVSGGVGGYTYRWTPNVASNNTANSLAAGTYKLTVTDANFCTAEESITLSDPPAVSSIKRVERSPTNASTVNYTVLFSKRVTGLDISDFTLSTTDGVSGDVSGLSGSGSTYTVTVTGVTGDGTLRLDLKPAGTGIVDDENTPVVGGYTSGEVYVIDNTPPAPPANFKAIGGDKKITLTWNPNTESDFYQYRLSVQEAGGVKVWLANVSNTAPTFIHENLPNGATYSYFLSAEDNTGNSSMEVTAAAKTMGEQTIAFGALSNMTYGDTDKTLTATAGSGLPVSYGSSNPAIASVYQDAADGNKWKVRAHSAGAVVITATQVGDNQYLPATPINQSLTIDKAPLTITADAQSKIYGEADPALTYQVAGLVNNDSRAVITGKLSRVVGENVGTYSINKGNLDAGANYTMGYTGANLSISKATITGVTLVDKTFTYDGTAKSLLLTGTLPTGAVANYTGNVQINAGVYSVKGEVSETANYKAASYDATLTILKAKQTISFSGSEVLSRDAGTVALDVRSSSGLPVTLSVDDPSIATVSGTDLHVLRLGTIRVTAVQAGNENYEAASPVTVSVRVANDASAKLPISVHQALSPNGDGINEFLMIEGIQDYPENKVTVFDKNGVVLAEIEGYNNRENVFTGKDSRDGTYYYYLDVRDNGVWKREKGYFVIRR